MDDNIKMVSIEDNENPVNKISELVRECFKTLKGKDLLITNRRFSGGYFSSFADSLYEYEKGIVLLERFFKKDKCKLMGQEYKELSDKDKDLIKEFDKFAKNIPSTLNATTEEKNNYSKKLEDYQKRLKKITPEAKVLNEYRYENTRVELFDEIDEKILNDLSNLYSSFGITMLATFTWGSVNNLSFGITTINHDDYVDLILIPLK